MISENEYKDSLIKRLNKKSSGWMDGDKEVGRKKTADIVNHDFRMAIEIKDEPTGSSDSLQKANQQYGDHLRSAYQKFKQYPGYKTILLIRGGFSTIPDIAYYAINGLITFRRMSGGLAYSGNKNKYQFYIRREIGCFLIKADQYYYYSNQHALKERIIDKNEIEDMLDFNLTITQ